MSMHSSPRRRILAGSLTALVALSAAGTAQAYTVPPPTPSGPTTEVHLLGFNDFHGYIDPNTNLSNVTPATSQSQYGQYVAGAPALAKTLANRRTLYPSGTTATLHAGDAIGGSQFGSSVYFEEPSIIALNHMQLDVAAVGNHEFDKGFAELVRIQNGCAPSDPASCSKARTKIIADNPSATPAQSDYKMPDGTTQPNYPGANFPHLGINVIQNPDGIVGNGDDAPLFPAAQPGIPAGTFIKEFPATGGGTVKVGFIGAVLAETPTIVTPAGVAGLTFLPEAPAVNAAVPALQAAGANAIVLILHQGGSPAGSPTLNGCNGSLAGTPVAPVLSALDPAIGVVFTGHTHTEYNCEINIGGTTRRVVASHSQGRLISDVGLTIENSTGQLVSTTATNVLVLNSTTAPPAAVVFDPAKADPAVQAITDQYRAASATAAARVVGTLTAAGTTSNGPLREQVLGDLIADAQLAATSTPATGGAQIAFMNPGGVRAPLPSGTVTYGNAFTTQPFGNSLVTKTFTGDQIRRLLRQQFAGCGQNTGTVRVLLPSAGFRYEVDSALLASAPTTPLTPTQCLAVIGKIQLNGVEINPAGSYRVTMNSFLADGGDNFTVFREGTSQLGGAQDIDALEAYFAANTPTTPPALVTSLASINAGSPNRILPLNALPTAPLDVPQHATPLALLLLGCAGSLVFVALRRKSVSPAR
jgi:5'-nucleotidase